MPTTKISTAEWEVMRVLWNAGDPMTSREIIEALEGNSAWQPKTIRTLVNRLTDKGVLAREETGRVLSFSPTMAESACIRDESQTFLKRFFDGGLTPMLAHFLENEEVSQEELDGLRRLLDEKEGER
jgi:BlaI family transcriptional regulator, penicillinase repressor